MCVRLVGWVSVHTHTFNLLHTSIWKIGHPVNKHLSFPGDCKVIQTKMSKELCQYTWYDHLHTQNHHSDKSVKGALPVYLIWSFCTLRIIIQTKVLRELCQYTLYDHLHTQNHYSDKSAKRTLPIYLIWWFAHSESYTQNWLFTFSIGETTAVIMFELCTSYCLTDLRGLTSTAFS